jgi:hypothetical protein
MQMKREKEFFVLFVNTHDSKPILTEVRGVEIVKWSSENAIADDRNELSICSESPFIEEINIFLLNL